MTKTQAKQLVVNVENGGYAVSLKRVGWVSRRRNPPLCYRRMADYALANPPYGLIDWIVGEENHRTKCNFEVVRPESLAEKDVSASVSAEV